MNAIKKIGSAIETKYVALGVALTMPMIASANAQEPATVAAEKINALVPGVTTVGAAILGVTLAAVGFYVIRRMVRSA